MSNNDDPDLLMDLGFSGPACSGTSYGPHSTHSLFLPPPPAGFRPLARAHPPSNTAAAPSSPDVVDLTSETDEDDTRSASKPTPDVHRNTSPQPNPVNSNLFKHPEDMHTMEDATDDVDMAAATLAPLLRCAAPTMGEDAVARQLENMVSLLSSEDESPRKPSLARCAPRPGPAHIPGRTGAAAPSTQQTLIRSTPTAATPAASPVWTKLQRSADLFLSPVQHSVDSRF